MLIRIEAPHFVAAAAVASGFVIEAAPIIQYMNGWSLNKVQKYCERKGWKVQELS